MKRGCILVLAILAGLGFTAGCEKKTEPAADQNSVVSESKESPAREQKPTEEETLLKKTLAPGKTAVVLETNMGDIAIEMMEEHAPKTVENFLRYAKEGFYDGVIFHQVIRGFMIQTGGLDKNMNPKPTRGPIKNEFGLSNVRGTVAMTKLGGGPDSATSQFFINLGDNSSNLDNRDGGYTVFGKVIKGMDVVDKIAKVRTTVRKGYDDVPVEPVVIEQVKVIE